MANYVSVSLTADQLERYGEQLAHEMIQRGGGPMADSLDAAAAVYMGFTRERFLLFSRGGGSWPPLSPYTLAKRRKGRNTQGARAANLSVKILQARGVLNAGEAAILRDTGLLFNSITNFESEDLEAGVRVGTSVFYGVFHQEGGDDGRLPQREIFVEPDGPTYARITNVLEAGYQRSIDATGGGV